MVTCGVLNVLCVGGKFHRNVDSCTDAVLLERPSSHALRCVTFVSVPNRMVVMSASGATIPLPSPARA